VSQTFQYQILKSIATRLANTDGFSRQLPNRSLSISLSESGWALKMEGRPDGSKAGWVFPFLSSWTSIAVMLEYQIHV
jgi:hypothetical protein